MTNDADTAPLYPDDEFLQGQAQQMTSQQVERQLGAATCALTAAQALTAVYRDQVVSLRGQVDWLTGQLRAQAGGQPAKPAARARKR